MIVMPARRPSKFAKLLPAVVAAMAFAASRASQTRLLGSRFKHRLPRLLDARLQVRIAHRARLDEVDAAAEQRPERLLEPEKGLERQRLRRAALEFDEEIEIAPRRDEISARRRAEEVEPSHVEAAAQFLQFLVMPTKCRRSSDAPCWNHL